MKHKLLRCDKRCSCRRKFFKIRLFLCIFEAIFFHLLPFRQGGGDAPLATPLIGIIYLLSITYYCGTQTSPSTAKAIYAYTLLLLLQLILWLRTTIVVSFSGVKNSDLSQLLMVHLSSFFILRKFLDFLFCELRIPFLRIRY